MPDIVGYDTILEGDLPERAANYSSLSTFAAKTETDWEDELRGEEENRWGNGGLLGGLFEGLAAGKPFIVALLEAVGNAIFGGVAGTLTTLEEILDELTSGFGAVFQTVADTSESVAYAAARLAALESSSWLIVDPFAGTAGGLGADWDVEQFGSGGGEVQLSGSGTAVWDGFGGVDNEERCRWGSDQTTSDDQVVSVVVTALSGAYGSSVRLFGRVVNSGTIDTFVYADVFCVSGFGLATLGFSVDGAEQTLGSAGFTPVAGDAFDFYLGFDGDSDRFVLKRNGLTLVDEVPRRPSAIAKGAGFRSVGFGMLADGDPVTQLQASPGALGVFAARDQEGGS